MLERLGFCSKWIRWIKGCLESTSISILVNGSQREEFTPTKGDPLAPLLFFIVAERLAELMKQALHKNKLKGLRVRKNEVEVNML